MKAINIKQIFEPPLSWIINEGTKESYKTINLFLSRANWLSYAVLPEVECINEFIVYLEKFKNGSLVFRGCPNTLACALSEFGFNKYLISKEAILNLNENHFNKPSLKDLVRRGKRHGNVREVKSNSVNFKKLQYLMKRTRYGRLPKLKHLFRTEFDKNIRCFVFIDKRDNWIGAVTISQANEIKMHTELLLRACSAPVGIMEALIFEVFAALKEEGYKNWSLGEVPFIAEPGDFIKLKEYIIHRIGELFIFSYNFKGLYQFKEKFNPEWKNIYLCGRPDISYLSLIEMFFRCNYFKLMLIAAWNRLLGVH